MCHNGSSFLSFYIQGHYVKCNYISVHAVFSSYVFSLLGERFGSMLLCWGWWGLWNPWAVTPYCCSSTRAALILQGGSWDPSYGSGSEDQGSRSQGFLLGASSEGAGLEKTSFLIFSYLHLLYAWCFLKFTYLGVERCHTTVLQLHKLFHAFISFL